jgi:hypothetical protein
MNIPVEHQWINILNFINAFDTHDSELRYDNEVKDTYKFFAKAADMLDFA